MISDASTCLWTKSVFCVSLLHCNMFCVVFQPIDGRAFAAKLPFWAVSAVFRSLSTLFYSTCSLWTVSAVGKRCENKLLLVSSLVLALCFFFSLFCRPESLFIGYSTRLKFLCGTKIKLPVHFRGILRIWLPASAQFEVLRFQFWTRKNDTQTNFSGFVPSGFKFSFLTILLRSQKEDCLAFLCVTLVKLILSLQLGLHVLKFLPGASVGYKNPSVVKRGDFTCTNHTGALYPHGWFFFFS